MFRQAVAADADQVVPHVLVDPDRAERESLGAENVVSPTGPQPIALRNAPGAARISNKAFLSMTRDQYLSLLDMVGRLVREGKRGFIPPELPPILERLSAGVDARTWLDRVLTQLGVGWPTPSPAPS